MKLIMENWKTFLEEKKKKGLWDNIHAKRERGEKPAKPGDEDYPETLDIEEGNCSEECPKCSGKDPKAKCECKSEPEGALEEKKQKKNCGCGKDPCITYGSQNEEKQDNFKTHKMYDPNSDDVVDAETKEDHDEAGEDGYIHIDPETLRDILKDEGGAAGIDPFLDSDDIDADEDEIRGALEAMDDVGEHEEGDYILGDDKEIIVKIVKEELKIFLDEKRKKKKINKKSMPCNKPRRTNSHKGKSHVVKACSKGKEKIIPFGEKGASTAGKPKKGESAKMKAKRKSFKARHRKNIKKGKMSAAYWANKVKW